MSVLRALLRNKKVVGAIATIVFAVANRLGLGLDVGTVDIVCGSIITVILAITAKDKVQQRKSTSAK